MKILPVDTLSKKMTNLLNLAIDEAVNVEGKTPYRHGAVLFRSATNILSTGRNNPGNKIYGYRVPACHAEANALHYLNNLYGRRKWRFLRKAKGATHEHLCSALAEDMGAAC